MSYSAYDLAVLIAKKAHTIATLSSLHDRIMTRYYKFLVVNVLVFFCVGTAALQSFLVSFSETSGLEVIQIVADSFPTAGPFYVGWRKLAYEHNEGATVTNTNWSHSDLHDGDTCRSRARNV